MKVLVLLLLAACHPQGGVLLDRADRRLQAGDAHDALERYDRIAERSDISPRDRVLALTGAALACDKLGDPSGAIERLQRATAVEVPGISEPAFFYLAEHLRASDRPRALNLYYRAAAGSERNRNGKWPYQAAMDRIVQLSMSP